MNKQKLIFFTGAGISSESGIPTFGEQVGLREKLTRDFANEYPEEYKATIQNMVNVCNNAVPNAAHYAIAQMGFPIITMNIDNLHRRAGTQESNLIEIHGVLPTQEELDEEDFTITYDNLILYGDIAPKYETAIKCVKNLEYENSFFIVIGTSFYTNISKQLLKIAKQRHANIMVIDDSAVERVPKIVKYLSGKLINCSTCTNNSQYNNGYAPPHTCDMCTSLDNEEEYSMWELYK